MKALAESDVNILGFEFHHPFAAIDQINEYFDNVVVVPYLDTHTKTEYPDMLSYVKDLIKRRKESIRLWFAGYDDSGLPFELMCRFSDLGRRMFRLVTYLPAGLIAAGPI